MATPLTSIVTCAHNMRHLLPFALLSVRKQRSRDFEYLILDDGSTDGTWEYLKTLKHPWLRILKNEKKLGLTACRNRLLAEARGELLSILDADDMICPGKVELHSMAMTDASVGVVYGKAKLLTRTAQLYQVGESPPAGVVPGWDLVTPYYAVHSATTWRRSAVLAVGGYDPARTIVEDSDLFLKIGEIAKQVFVPRFAAVKRIFPDNEFRKSLNPQSIRLLSNTVLKDAIRRRFNLDAHQL